MEKPIRGTLNHIAGARILASKEGGGGAWETTFQGVTVTISGGTECRLGEGASAPLPLLDLPMIPTNSLLLKDLLDLFLGRFLGGRIT